MISNLTPTPSPDNREKVISYQLPAGDEVGVKEGELIEGVGGAEDGGVHLKIFEDGRRFGAGAAGGAGVEEAGIAGIRLTREGA